MGIFDLFRRSKKKASPASERSGQEFPLAPEMLDAWLVSNSSIVDLNLVEAHALTTVKPRALPRFYRELTRQWVRRLIDKMDNGYTLYESDRFLFVTQEDRVYAKEALRACHRVNDFLEDHFRGLMHYKFTGKYVILQFEGRGAYFAHMSQLAEGPTQTAASGGCVIKRGITHMALPGYHIEILPRILAHELSHLHFARFNFPAWVDEAMAIKSELAQRGVYDLADNTYDKPKGVTHHWCPETIQKFWSGESFSDPDYQNQSYALAVHLFESMLQTYDQVIPFLRMAHGEDFGAAAARKCLGRSLGDCVTDILGPGDWNPRGQG